METEQVKDYDPQVSLQQAADFVLECFNQHSDARLAFHNFQLAERMASIVQEIAQADNLDSVPAQIAALAAWFLPVGYAVDYHHPTSEALRELRRFIQACPCPEGWYIRISTSIQTVLNRQIPASVEERLLSDAYIIAGYIHHGEHRLALQKLEWELQEKQTPDKKAWLEAQWEQLLPLQLFNRYAKTAYQDKLGLLLLEAHKTLKKENQKGGQASEQTALFNFLEPENPVRAAQTFFRVNYRTHINLSSIADNKAHIMISVNSIMISILITFLSYKNIAEVKPLLLLPVLIFLVTGLTSLIFAVLSARPKVTTLNTNQKDPNEIRKNIAFFGNFVSLELHDYETAMNDLFHNTELLYGNMTRDLYFLGKVLDKKYRYLTISYTLFMVGFAATVLTFVYVLFA